jgi:PleD family two-component response regulator
MRGQLRPLDLAGTLTEGEIGLLMHDTTAHHAKNIAERLRAIVGGAGGSGSILIGVATRTPGMGRAEGLVREARADALGGENSPANSAYSSGVRP